MFLSKREDNLEQERTTSIGQRCARHALTNSTNLFLEGQNRPLFRRLRMKLDTTS